MNLNPYVFSDSLAESGYVFEEYLHTSVLTADIRKVTVFHPLLPVEEDTAYIIDANVLDAILYHRAAMLFVIGQPAHPIPETANVLLFPKSIDSIKLYQKVQGILVRYQEWERQMYILLGTNAPLRSLVECCLPFVTNPLAIASSDLRILTYAENPDKAERYRCFKPEDIGQYLPNEEIEAFKYDPEYVAGITARTPQMLNNAFFGFRFFYNNIYVSNTYIARVVICEVDRPVRRSDYLLLLTMTELFSIALVNQDISLNNHPPRFDGILLALLNREKGSGEQLAEALKLVEWNMEDAFFCCIFESNFDRRIHSTQSMCRQLESQIIGSICLVFRDRIVMILNLSRTGSTREDLRIRISELVRENILKVGISNLFYDFSQLPWFLEQAEDALRFGTRLDESFWCYDYDTYALRSFLSRIRGDRNLAALCPEKLQILLRYDQSHDRNYVQVLRAYLENNMSVVKTTRTLYMQRATLLYQLRRIEEISGLDLHNPEVRLYLLNYFSLTDLEQAQHLGNE